MSLLPLGSIVVLKTGSKKIMIYGRKQYDVGREMLWDYVACLYPEGNISPDYSFLFNHSDIEEVFFRGFEDQEEQEFLEVLNLINEHEQV